MLGACLLQPPPPQRVLLRILAVGRAFSQHSVLSTQAWPDTAAQLGWGYPRVLPSNHLLSPFNKADPGGALFRPPRSCSPLAAHQLGSKTTQKPFPDVANKSGAAGLPQPWARFPAPSQARKQNPPLAPRSAAFGNRTFRARLPKV